MPLKFNRFFAKLSILFSYDPAITLPGIYSNELKFYVYTKTCMWIFIDFFIIAKIWKQSRCPSANE